MTILEDPTTDGYRSCCITLDAEEINLAKSSQVMLIDKVPDDVLLAIFDFYVDGGVQVAKKAVESWQTLVHVCRRWRCVIFESPRRLDLQLVCTSETPARDTLEVWPPLPLLIHGSDYPTSSVDNIVAALEHNNRVCQITLEYVTSMQLEEIWAAMREPFPELTHLQLRAYDDPAPEVPDSFMDGSAPRLGYLNLDGIPYPGLPNLLLSATNLVTLQLTMYLQCV